MCVALKEAINILGIAVRVIRMLSEVKCALKVELTAIISETQHSLNTATYMPCHQRGRERGGVLSICVCVCVYVCECDLNSSRTDAKRSV